MKVILTETVDKLGSVGDVVSVRNGFARNYLFPKKKAVLADEKNRSALEHRKRVLEAQLKREQAQYEEQIKKIEQKSITISKKAGEEEKLFGSVTSADIVEALEKEGIDFVDKKQLVIAEPIKQLGVFSVEVKVAPSFSAQLKIFVVAE